MTNDERKVEGRSTKMHTIIKIPITTWAALAGAGQIYTTRKNCMSPAPDAVPSTRDDQARPAW